MSFSHLLFDFDHMLFDTDSSEALAFARALVQSGIDKPERYLPQYQSINQRLWRQVEAGTISPNDVKTLRFELLKTELGLNYNSAAVAENYITGLVECGELFPGARRLLEDLEANFSLGMITNGIGPVQRGRMERLGLRRFFDSVVISGEVGVAKPRPEIFALALAELGDPPRSNCLMIGDSLPSDIQGGQNAGIPTAWFNPKGTANFTSLEPTFEFANFDRLVDVLGDSAWGNHRK
ncbi:MAG: noncanonical pyrimidine nucleotidase, YjjG family [Acidimicrobiales bacterium]|nr:noncanonical pyrimidine nucleotidase, YjjG family [Acidimicrobiales bacterium]